MTPIIFDLDGTLIDSLPDITGAANALLAEKNLPPLEASKVAGFVGRGERVLLDRLIAATALDAADYDALMAQFIDIYKGATGRTRVFPGAREALEHFRAAGVPVGLCTNKPSGPLGSVLEALDLSRLFDVIVAGDTLAARKPDAAPLLHAVSSLGAERCIYVGDSEIDAETAQAAGMPFAFFTEGIRTVAIADIPHDAAFSDFADLPSIYARLSEAQTG